MVPSQSAESDTSTLPDLMEPSDLMRIKEQATLYVPFHRRFSHDDRLKSSQGDEGRSGEEGEGEEGGWEEGWKGKSGKGDGGVGRWRGGEMK